MSEKIYVGKGKKVGKFNQIKIGIRVSDLEQHKNDKGYVNLIIQEMRETDKYGNEYTVVVDDWKPTNGYSNQERQQPAMVGVGATQYPF